MTSPSNVTKLPMPERRPLRVFAFDPRRRGVRGNKMQGPGPPGPLGPGPVDRVGTRDRTAVVDYDPSPSNYYWAIDRDVPFILMTDGIAPSESDPRFHQQMVYAIASDTIEQFD